MKRIFLLLIILICSSKLAYSQQFVTDGYVTMPYGTANLLFTAGERSSTVLPSLGLLHNWEFFLGASLINKDKDRGAEDHFATILMAKWMFYENANKTGGAAITFGTGSNPAYYVKNRQIESFRNYSAVGDFTLPLFNNLISWDLNPGVLLDFNRNNDSNKATWGFTYASRIAIYKIIPKTAIVGEIYGAMGEASSNPEYRFGLRFEGSSKVVPAITFGNSLNGSKGPGFEIGLMIFSSPFLFD